MALTRIDYDCSRREATIVELTAEEEAAHVADAKAQATTQRAADKKRADAIAAIKNDPKLAALAVLLNL